jgi:hypothetical protein
LAVSPQGICIMKIVAASLPQEIADAASALEEERLEEDPRETTAINTGYTLVLTLQLDLMPKVQNTLGEYGLCRSNQRYSSPTSRPLLRHNARGNHENHRAGSYTNRQRGRAGIRCWCPGRAGGRMVQGFQFHQPFHSEICKWWPQTQGRRQVTWRLCQGARVCPADQSPSSKQCDA